MENTQDRMQSYENPEQESMQSFDYDNGYANEQSYNTEGNNDYSQYQGEQGSYNTNVDTTSQFINIGSGLVYNPNYGKGKQRKAKQQQNVGSRREQEAYNRGMRDILHSIGVSFKSVQNAIKTADPRMNDEDLMEEIGFMVKDFLRINMFANETTMNIDNYVRKGGDAFQYIQAIQPMDYKSMSDRDIYISYMRASGIKDNLISDQLDELSDTGLTKNAKTMRRELIASQPTEESVLADADKFREDNEKHFEKIEEHLYYVAKKHLNELTGINTDHDIANLIEYAVPHQQEDGTYVSGLELDLFSGIGNPDVAKESDYMPILLAANELLNGRLNKEILMKVGERKLFNKINLPVKQRTNRPNIDNTMGKFNIVDHM